MTVAIPIEQSESAKVFRYDVYTNLVERKFSERWRVVKQKSKGYTQVFFNGRLILLHRLIYTLYHGNIDEGMQVDHHDGNPENNAISNLQLLSNQDNTAKSRAGISPNFDKKSKKYLVHTSVDFDKKRRTFNFKHFKKKADAQKMCDAYNAQFGYGKPLYKVRLGTYKKWREYMQAFTDSYFNTIGNSL